ncbi:MAG: hypothetical protein AAGI46_06560 [Planctomycetota bacterium]
MPNLTDKPHVSPLVVRVAEAFGVAADRSIPLQRMPRAAVPAAGTITLLAGPSGGGKSTRLRQIVAKAKRRGHTIHDVAGLRLSRLPCIDQFGRSDDLEADLAFAAGRLAQVGLGEARVLISSPMELSDGQRWRLRLALTVAKIIRKHGRNRGNTSLQRHLLVADEFAAVLDRVTACIVARSVRKAVDRLARVGVPVAAVVATSHDDLTLALSPDRIVRCEA